MYVASLATGLETMSCKELTEQVNLDARELGAFPLGKRRFRGWVEARWGNSERR